MAKKIFFITLITAVIASSLAFAYIYFVSPQTITSITSGQGITLSDLFPFGQAPETSVPTDSPDDLPDTGSQTPAQLRQIYASPVSGGAFFGTSTNTVIRFVEQSTGNIFETSTINTSVQRITNSTVPKVLEALFVTKDSVLFRYLQSNTDLIETMYGNINTTTSTSTIQSEFASLDTTFLFPNIKDVVVSPLKNSIIYTNQFTTGVIATRAQPNGSNKTVVFESPVKEWNIQWPTSTLITLTTAPSAQVAGFMYTKNLTTGAEQQVLSNIAGLTTRSNNTLSKVLYSKSTSQGGFTLHTLDTTSGTSTMFTFGQTFPEKCVWSTQNNDIVYCATPKQVLKNEYPDAWYRGEVSFSDALWRINTATNQTDKLVDFEAVAGRPLDAIDLSLDPSEQFILFRNKSDFTLWSYAL